MFPADGVHGFGGVQVAFYAYVALTCALTGGLWLLGLPTELTVVAFVPIGGLLLIPFWPLFTAQHPEHDDEAPQ
ncbi:hypothetical protein [Halopiger aswanensis]|uniref:Uncharacterized protein n=1 Tax=Halopiger aswanensis TaxID=148449 RepID=A0A419WHQ0_9EURY|nr:hypothetical protein [Halopiger aswanensis]RKD94892.1 hypothetical protein ATJ93_1735 [Halopiger aswanensis]